MKTKLSIFLGLMMIFALIVPASAQTMTATSAPGTWTSSINLQNNGGGAATVVIDFYDASGNVAFSYTDISGANTIPAGGSRTVVLQNVASMPAGSFSVVISSDQPIDSIANLVSKTPVTAGAYQGMGASDIGTLLYFPGLYKSYYGFSSELVLQNTTASAATVTIEFYSQSTGAIIGAATLLNQAIPANSSRTFSLASVAGLPTGSAGLVSAKVTSTQPIAGVANIWSAYMYGEFGDYNGYLGGNTTLYAPALYKNYYGFVSALTVMNIGTVTTGIQVTYSNGTTETTTVDPYQAKQFYQPNNASLPSGNTSGVFSAKVVSTGTGGGAAQPIIALVNVEDKTKGLLGSYNVPSEYASVIGCPVVMQSYYGWFSAETVQNVGNAATDIKVTYASGQTKTFTNVPVNGVVNVIEITGAGSVLPNTSSVSAKFESLSGQPLVVVTQENNSRYSSAPGDYLLAYTCKPMP